MSFLDIDMSKTHIRIAIIVMIFICVFIIRYTVLSKPMIKDYILSKKEYNIINFIAEEKQKFLDNNGAYKDLRLFTNMGITAYGEEPQLENFVNPPLKFSKFLQSCENINNNREINYKINNEGEPVYELPTPYDYDNINKSNSQIPRESIPINNTVPSEKTEVDSDIITDVLDKIVNIPNNKNILINYKQLELNGDYSVIEINNNDTTDKINNIYDIIIDDLVTKINTELNYSYDCGVKVLNCYDDNCNYSSVKQNIVSVSYSETDNIFIIDGNFDIHRTNKAYTFGIYCKVYYDANKELITYSTLKLNTMTWENNIYMIPGVDLKNTPTSSNLRIYSQDYDDKIVEQTTYSQNEINELKKYPIEYDNSNNEDNYDDGVCLNKYASTKYVCESNFDNLGRYVGPGIWDKKCTSNEDCPYYKKNENYDNERGGCIDGFCELPKNMELVGFTNYNSEKKPYCYNCNDPSNYECCSEQEDRTEYPNLKSPDYMFENDTDDRL